MLIEIVASDYSMQSFRLRHVKIDLFVISLSNQLPFRIGLYTTYTFNQCTYQLLESFYFQLKLEWQI